jgi:excisionase family DNA binding protein
MGRKPKTKGEAMVTSNLLTVAQVCERTGLAERTVRRYIKKKILPVTRFGPLRKDGKPCNVRVDAMDLEFMIRAGKFTGA